MGIEVLNKGEMECELEEGEACSFTEDSTIDPDMTFSYIGEKIRNVLGHFQKDFEGGASFENLGRKTGDYGTFLPENLCLTPTPSHSASLQKLRTPNSASFEKMMFQRNATVTLEKALIPKKIEENGPPPGIRESTRQPDMSNSESKSTNQKTLKVRIKVGSDALKKKPNSSIYSVMGLEYSPSSSLDSPYPNGGSSQESPMSICQIMTLCPVPAESIISPLRENFLQLRENCPPVAMNFGRAASSMGLEDFRVSGDEKVPSEKSMKKLNAKSLLGRECVPSAVEEGKKSHRSGYERERLSKVRVSSSGITLANEEATVSNFRNTETSNNQVFGENLSKYEKTSEVYNLKKDVNSKFDEFDEREELKGPKVLGQTCEKPPKLRKPGIQMNTSQPLESSIDRKKVSLSKADPSEYEKAESAADAMEVEHNRRKDQNPSSSEALVPNVSISREASTPADVLVKEDWVCCDMCQKWRLLPYGTNPNQLPKKWLCTMLDWLPGMNKCSIGEDETTRALHASYHAPLPDNHASNCPNTSLLPLDPTQKKLSVKPLDSAKKSHQVSIKSRSLNDDDNGFHRDGLLQTKGKVSKSMFKAVDDQDGNRESTNLKSEEVTTLETSKKVPRSRHSSLVDDKTSPCKDLYANSSGSHREQVRSFEKESVGKDSSSKKRKSKSQDLSPSGKEKRSRHEIERRKDLPCGRSSTPAFSSSSKVSSFVEARGSPVESVSSSPLRVFNGDDLGKEKDKSCSRVWEGGSSGQKIQPKETSRSREKQKVPESKASIDEAARSEQDERKREPRSRKEDMTLSVGKSQVNPKPLISREPAVLAPPVTKGDEVKTLKSEAEEEKKQVSKQSSAAAILKEARDLKHTADRLKNEGLETESTSLYFEAALKFLHVAFLRESPHMDGENTPSMEMYSSTAKLCEFCAHLYEKNKEMASAALAYKCMEVANMKVVFFKDSGANKDRNELHSAFLLASTGESPSSSASDIDNLNNQNAAEKSAHGKALTSPHSNPNHIVSAHNRPRFFRLLNYVQDVHDAMDASKKSLNAFNAISGMKSEIVASVKQVLALGFHDVEAFLRLVRMCVGSISS